MKIIALLMALSCVAASTTGCEQEQDVGDNDDGGGGSGGDGTPVGSCVGAGCGDNCMMCSPNQAECETPTYQGFCSADGACVPQQPQCTVAGCGNGAVDGNEQCDDGNQIDGDGCSANCTVELSCQTKLCGEGCLTCPPNEPECLDPSYQGYCDLQGACVALVPTCQ